jgi:hypothetical protein
MIISILFACSILAVSILVWLFRQRLAQHLPSKETVSTFCLVAPVVLLLCVAILPDVLLLISALSFMPHYLKTILGLSAAACIIYAGCSKKADSPKQPAIEWTAPDTGYHAETPPTIPKEGQ